CVSGMEVTGVKNLSPDLYIPSHHSGWGRLFPESRLLCPAGRALALAGSWKDGRAALHARGAGLLCEKPVFYRVASYFLFPAHLKAHHNPYIEGETALIKRVIR